MKQIPLSIPYINGNEWRYIKECLDTGWVSSAGKYVERFELEVGRITGIENTVACVNGTAALHTALILMDVFPGDEVITPTVTFIAPVNAVSYVKAKPVFMDCDDYYNINVEKTLDFIKNETVYKSGFTFNKKTRNKISAIIPVHVFGNAADLDVLIQICRERNIRIIEDAAESFGTYYIEGNWQNIHTGALGDIGCFSFNGNKIVTTGGGGIIATNNQKYAEKARYLTTQAKDDKLRYIHNETGFNYRLTNIQAAIGVAQLEDLPNRLKIKKQNYLKYKKAVDQIPGLNLADTPSYANNNHWMYALQVNRDVYGKNNKELMRIFSDNHIQTRPLWHLNHLQNPYNKCQSFKIEKALKMLELTLNIPCSVNLTDNEIEKVVWVMKNG
jgi:perosamine synthetase